ncbi:BRO-N domain-containing protein [Ectopseudomonas hydrolytica]|uniref:BRO-N domain-containing protein n=1 Tax=Ectopseudomonas hydrolytica TaxID=2493633 RepID=UPI003C2FA05B
MNTTAIDAVGNVQEKTAQVFQFKQQQDVRAILINGEPWFVAGDVAQALGYPEAAKMTRILDDDEKGLHIVETLGGAQEMLVINESGLYSAILRSRKPEAKAFKKWVTAEVLPAIRKHGMYLHAPAMRPALTKEQWRQIDMKIHMMTASWAFGNHSKNWIYNHMRVVFQVARFEDVPADQFDVVMQMINSKYSACSDFTDALMQLRDWFEKEVLGGGHPWTPTIKAKLTKQLKRQVILPPKTDWLALAKMVDDAAEGKAA